MTASENPASAVERLMSKNQNTPRIMIWAPDEKLFPQEHSLAKRWAHKDSASAIASLCVELGIPSLEIAPGIDGHTHKYTSTLYFDRNKVGNHADTLDEICDRFKALLGNDMNVSQIVTDPSKRRLWEKGMERQFGMHLVFDTSLGRGM